MGGSGDAILDWLIWFDVPGRTDAAFNARVPANLAVVVRKLAHGRRSIASSSANAVRSQADLTESAKQIGTPVQVICACMCRSTTSIVTLASSS